ncbi:MAG: hypothetical protein KDD51_03480 [Bdellovibrionales bacterium]|nr:hypothetical protein [Bdellovibrionales bacterium]
MKIIIGFLTLFLFLSIPARAQDTNCANIHSAVQIAIIQKENLGKKLSELEARFKEHLERDIDAQADGILESFHRNEAKKVYFAKKKLSRAIEKKTENITSMSAFYCKSCKKNEASAEEFCRICPNNSECEAADL